MKKYLLLLLLIPNMVLADIKDIDFNNNNFYKGIKEQLLTKVIDDYQTPKYNRKEINTLKDLTNKLIKKNRNNEILKHSYNKNSDRIIKDIHKKIKSLHLKVNYIEVTDIIDTNEYLIAKVIVDTKEENIGLTYFIKDNKIFNLVLEPNDIIKNFYNDAINNNVFFDETYNIFNNETPKIPNIDYTNVVVLHTYTNNTISESATGFFISDGIIATSFTYLNNSLNKSNTISVTNNKDNYYIVGLVDFDPHLDIALLKVNRNDTGHLKIEDGDDNYIFQVGTKNKFNLSTTGGHIIDKDKHTYLLPSSKSDAGAPLFNQSGKIIGMTKYSFLESPITLSIDNNILKNIQNKLNEITYDKIKVINLKNIQRNFYISNINKENNIQNKDTEKFSTIGDLSNSIDLSLIKSSYKNNVATFKYQANNAKVIGNLSKTTIFTNNLISEGYKVSKSNIKEIYSNKKHNVILLDIFNYLLIMIEEK